MKTKHLCTLFIPARLADNRPVVWERTYTDHMVIYAHWINGVRTAGRRSRLSLWCCADPWAVIRAHWDNASRPLAS